MISPRSCYKLKVVDHSGRVPQRATGMPEETKGTDPVSPEPSSPAAAPVASGEGAGSGAKASAETSSSSAAPTVPPSSAPAAKAAAPAAAKAAEPAKPAAVATVAAKGTEPAKPAASATGEKPTAPAAAKPAAPAAAKPAPKPEGPKPEPWEADLVTRLRSQYGSGIKEASTYVGQKLSLIHISEPTRPY